MRRKTEQEYIEKFWSKVNKTEDCWLWIGPSSKGKDTTRAKFTYNGTQVLAYHFIWYLLYGVFPTKMICHTCDNGLCVKPDHLFEGTRSENMFDASRKNRTTWYSNEKIMQVHLLHEEGLSNLEISDRLGIHKTYVSKIINKHKRLI